MDDRLDPTDRAKRAAARHAADAVADGMRVGLGTGSTAAWAVRRLGERVRDDGLRVVGVPTSEATARLARDCGVPLTTLDEAGRLDLTIDGADEADAALDLIKGGGAALLREKIVAAASDRLVIVADAAKRVATLGAFPLPVEVAAFGWRTTMAAVARALEGRDVARRDVAARMAGDAPLTTDGGNHVLDLRLDRIGDAAALSDVLLRVPGVVETGLFLGMADELAIGHGDGRVDVHAPDRV